MSMTHINFYRGSALAAGSDAYTVPTGASAIVTNIVIANVTNTAHYATIKLGGFEIISNGPVNAYDTLVLDIRQVLAAGEKLFVQADANSALTVHASGVLITTA